jgi:hypothetical protein
VKHVTITRMVEVEVECIVAVEPAERGTPRSMHGPGTPDWPASAELVEVRLGGSFISTDVLHCADIAAIEAQAIEEYEESEAEGEDPDDASDRARDLRDSW